jgi:F-box/WD-40 domain protein MET30
MCLQYHTSLTSPSYPVLITGSYDRTVRVWNLDTGEEVRTLRGHDRAVRALQFDQMLLFTGSMDGTVRMWNWRAGECLRVLEGHTDGVVALNYNGYLLASGSADSTIQVWNFRTGGKFTLRGHTDWVNSVVLWDGKTSPGDIDPTLLPTFSQGAIRSRNTVPGLNSSSAHKSDAKGTFGQDTIRGHNTVPTYNGLNPSSTHKSDANGNKLPEIEPGAMLFSASDDGTI